MNIRPSTLTFLTIFQQIAGDFFFLEKVVINSVKKYLEKSEKLSV